MYTRLVIGKNPINLHPLLPVGRGLTGFWSRNPEQTFNLIQAHHSTIYGGDLWPDELDVLVADDSQLVVIEDYQQYRTWNFHRDFDSSEVFAIEVLGDVQRIPWKQWIEQYKKETALLNNTEKALWNELIRTRVVQEGSGSLILDPETMRFVPDTAYEPWLSGKEYFLSCEIQYFGTNGVSDAEVVQAIVRSWGKYRRKLQLKFEFFFVVLHASMRVVFEKPCFDTLRGQFEVMRKVYLGTFPGRFE